jgi:hypothetical protein
VSWLRVESVLRRETAPAARHAGVKKPATGFKPARFNRQKQKTALLFEVPYYLIFKS